LGSPRRLWRWASFVARQYSHRRTTENLHDCLIVSQLSASHGSRFPLAVVVQTANQGLAKRLGASPNRPAWSGAAVQAPKEGRSGKATTRCIKGMENGRSAIFSAVTPPLHTSFGPRFLHQCPRWPNGATFGFLVGWSHWWRCSQAGIYPTSPFWISCLDRYTDLLTAYRDVGSLTVMITPIMWDVWLELHSLSHSLSRTEKATS